MAKNLLSLAYFLVISQNHLKHGYGLPLKINGLYQQGRDLDDSTKRGAAPVIKK